MVVAMVVKGSGSAESLARHQLVYLRMYADGNARVAVKAYMHDDGLAAVKLSAAIDGGSRRRVSLTSIPMPSWDITCQDEVQV